MKDGLREVQPRISRSLYIYLHAARLREQAPLSHSHPLALLRMRAHHFASLTSTSPSLPPAKPHEAKCRVPEGTGNPIKPPARGLAGVPYGRNKEADGSRVGVDKGLARHHGRRKCVFDVSGADVEGHHGH
jgi:hypothetical protein